MKRNLKKSEKVKTDKEQEKENKSSFLNDCKKVFAQTDFYLILGLNKSDASPADIKKAYYKLALKHHPDKVTDDSKKEESNFKFQLIGKIYNILSDTEKRKLYDESGLIDNEENDVSDERDWSEYCKKLFKKVTKEDFEKFFEKYRESEEEKNDLFKSYEKHKGNMDRILEEMYSENMLEDEPRFKNILLEAIEKEQVKKYEKFINENKKKASKRKAHYEHEAKEAEELKKEMGIDESQDSLRNAIMARRKEQSNNFLEHLANKYSKTDKNEKVLKFSKNKPNVRKSKNKGEESESEEEEEEEDEKNFSDKVNQEADEVNNESDEDFENDGSPSKKKLTKQSSLIKKRPTKKTPTKKAALKKKVKRL